MQIETIKKLNQLNQDFYTKTNQYWNNDPNYFWEGWNQVGEWVDQNFGDGEVSVLDLGCGNARFVNFLLHKTKVKIRYIGVELNSELINASQIKPNPRLTYFKIVQTDLGESEWINKLEELDLKFDLVVLFGLFHNIPGSQIRLNILQESSNLLKSKGLLVFTGWRFVEKPRLNKRIIQTTAPNFADTLNEIGIKLDQMEYGDYILNWNKRVYCLRYTHHIDQNEAKEITQQTGLKIIKYYIEDSLDRDQNDYWWCIHNNKT
jgi:SAM-dependent methyltransferase